MGRLARGLGAWCVLVCLAAIETGPAWAQTAPTGPSRVRIEGTGFRYTYTVNGSPEVIRGFGYNLLPGLEGDAARQAQFRRDFRAIRAAGGNTIVGWEQRRFDRLLLDAAAENGLGVILPFELPPDADYADAGVRAELTGRALAWVAAYRDHPALRMWGLGNEVIHDMALPTPERVAAFARFLVEAADAVHALDPDHPVIYREAEDVFVVPYLTRAFAERPAERPWFVYGMNFFTFRLEEALARWPARGLPGPVVVSEYGPLGYLPAARPVGYVRLWRTLRGYPDYVLGGLAYVWHHRGPDPADPEFGLVDDDDVPRDGSLAALAGEYGSGESGAPPALAAPTPGLGAPGSAPAPAGGGSGGWIRLGPP
jgi:hypothetical protein